jgi:hypothetical protein
MAEFAAFTSDEPFDLKDWVNTVLADHMAGGPTPASPSSSTLSSTSSTSSSASSIDSHISTLVHKLQYLSHDVNETLDDCMDKMMASAPRTSRELARVQEEAVDLRGRVGTLQVRRRERETDKGEGHGERG